MRTQSIAYQLELERIEAYGRNHIKILRLASDIRICKLHKKAAKHMMIFMIVVGLLNYYGFTCVFFEIDKPNLLDFGKSFLYFIAGSAWLLGILELRHVRRENDKRIKEYKERIEDINTSMFEMEHEETF